MRMMTMWNREADLMFVSFTSKPYANLYFNIYVHYWQKDATQPSVSPAINRMSWEIRQDKSVRAPANHFVDELKEVRPARIIGWRLKIPFFSLDVTLGWNINGKPKRPKRQAEQTTTRTFSRYAMKHK